MSDGGVFLRCSGLDIITEDVNVSANRANVTATEVEVSAEQEAKISAEKVVVESGDVELGDEGGKLVVRDGDDVVITNGFLSALIQHTHTTVAGPTGIAQFMTPLTGVSIGKAKSSAERVKAK